MPDRIGPAFGAVWAFFHGRHLKCDIGAPLVVVVRSRQVRVAGIAQTERTRFGPGTTRSPIGKAPLSIDRRREPARAALAIEFASRARCPVLPPRPHGLTPFHPSGGSARERGGREPPSGRSDRGAVTGPVG